MYICFKILWIWYLLVQEFQAIEYLPIGGYFQKGYVMIFDIQFQ